MNATQTLERTTQPTRFSFCTFRIGELYCGVEVRQVQEVLRHQKTTDVPLADGVIRGLMNLRGQIVTAMDMRLQFGITADDLSNPPMNVVMCTPDGPVSLLVDEIGDVVEVAPDDFEHPPETLSGPGGEFIRGACKLKDRLLLILDTTQILNVQ